MICLCLETSGEICSIALFENEQLIAERSYEKPNSHAEYLHTGIEDLLTQHRIRLDAIAVSGGPGSYTGLRIGVSAAKGLAFGFGIPIIAISTLELMANIFINSHRNFIQNQDLLIPMIDARRMEVYHAVFNAQSHRISEDAPLIVERESFQKLNPTGKLHVFGTGATKCREILTDTTFSIYDNVALPEAKSMGIPAFEKWKSGNFVDTAYYEPNYVKDFHFTQKKS
ncbi:MAG: tRNA (adenosine(37)-N6)-threonylcarbamoyltransferase complex dimerization subunit type 1 TsaB [Bacteroidetes bacterium]|nr:tRNA (adenosine(37)-N6)-threonylcarbamoyltransferase complex dimerization subunit type 1 TsaB [Bacteroidota bacterium]